MKIIDFIYQGQNVQFSNNGNLMVNATQMANIFGAEVTHFLENKSTEKFIQACLEGKYNSQLKIKSKDDIIFGKQRSGTWMHEILALKFAAWLDPDFEIWMILSIRETLLQYYSEFENYKDAVKRKKDSGKRLKDKKDKLMANPEFIEYLKLEEEYKKQSKNVSKVISENSIQLYLFESE